MREAAANGHYDVLEYLTSANPDLKCDEEAISKAASKDFFQVVEWMERHAPGLAPNASLQTAHLMAELLHAHADSTR